MNYRFLVKLLLTAVFTNMKDIPRPELRKLITQLDLGEISEEELFDRFVALIEGTNGGLLAADSLLVALGRRAA